MSPEATIATDHELRWFKSLPELIDIATAARERGVSYRQIPFKVGAAALVYSRTDGEYGFLDGANYKPHSDGPRKCAEEEVFGKVEELGVEIIGMVVVAPHQVDDHTGIDLGATPCCTSCRKIIRAKVGEEKPYITATTQLVFVNGDLPTKRVRLSVGQMFHIFNGEH